MKYLIIFLLLVFDLLLIKAQPEKSIDFNKDCIIKNSEKVFIDVDQQILVSGQYLNYKAYVVNSSMLSTENCSKILYFEIIDSTLKQVLSWRCNIKNGSGFGMVQIPDSISAGIYYLYAFTNWQRNVSPDRYFKLPLLITRLSEKKLEHINLIEPEILPSAEVLSSEISISPKMDEHGGLIIDLNPDSPVIINGGHLKISSHGQDIYDKAIILKDGKASINLLPENLSAGIIDISITDKQDRPVQHKLFCFNNLTDFLIVKLLKDTFSIGDKIQCEFDTKGMKPDDFLNLSVSVVEKNNLSNLIGKPQIVSQYLFNAETGAGEIKGQSLSDPLTELSKVAYSNYEWNPEKLQNIESTYFKENKGFLLSGKLIDNNSGVGIDNAVIYLSKIDSVTQIKYTVTDKNGNFYFVVDTTYDNHKMIVQTPNSQNPKQYRWDIEDKWAVKFPKSNMRTQYITDEEESDFDSYRKDELIHRVYNRNSDSIQLKDVYSENSFYLKPDIIVRPSDYEDLPNFQEIAANILPTVRFKKTRTSFSYGVYIKDYQKLEENAAGIFLNGVLFNNPEFIYSLTSADINRVEICNHLIFYGDLFYYGIISIYTKDMSLYPSSFKNPVIILDNKISRKDKIDDNSRGNNNIPDFTKCPYWNPQILLKANDKLVIEFNVPEIQAEFSVYVNGISGKGLPVTKITTFNVK